MNKLAFAGLILGLIGVTSIPIEQPWLQMGGMGILGLLHYALISKLGTAINVQTDEINKLAVLQAECVANLGIKLDGVKDTLAKGIGEQAEILRKAVGLNGSK